MSTTTNAPERGNGHGIDISDLDLDGVPATHRHAVRALRSELRDKRGISIKKVRATITSTTVRLSVEENAQLLGTRDVRRALRDTGVKKAELRTGYHSSIKLGYCLGFEV